MSRKAKKPERPWRFYFVVLVLCSMLALLTGRVISLQVLDTDRGYQFLQGQGEMRSVRTVEIPAYRGMISDRRGEPLAVSTPVVSIWANPKILQQSQRLPELAQALGVPLKTLTDKLARHQGKQFMYLQRHRVPADARKVLEKRVEGVYGEREYRRFYPAGEVAAHLVGFTDVDDRGLGGLELAYDDWLAGSPGKKKVIKDLHGDVVRDIGVLQKANPGKDLTLSIDLRLQYLAHRELQKAAAQTGASSGSIVTLDARSGEVLAMVNYPVYNPNNRKSMKPSRMRNRAMTDVYEPGSTMKALTLVAALESGKYTTQTLIDTTPGTIRVGRKLLKDPINYGEITLSRVVEKSSQVGITKVAQDIGHQPIWNVLNRFGLGQTPGTGFPGESGGQLPTRPKWHAIEKVTLAFGYGLTATPLQIAHAFSILANDGAQQPISLLALEDEPTVGKPVITPALARNVLEVLHAVTGENGTARKAQIAGYGVGGKTGTVHKVGLSGYMENEYVALFAGVAPIENPRIVTVVVIDQPKGEAHGGGSAAAPVFSRVVKGALRLLNVPPTDVHTIAGSGQPLHRLIQAGAA